MFIARFSPKFKFWNHQSLVRSQASSHRDWWARLDYVFAIELAIYVQRGLNSMSSIKHHHNQYPLLSFEVLRSNGGANFTDFFRSKLLTSWRLIENLNAINFFEIEASNHFSSKCLAPSARAHQQLAAFLPQSNSLTKIPKTIFLLVICSENGKHLKYRTRVDVPEADQARVALKWKQGNCCWKNSDLHYLPKGWRKSSKTSTRHDFNQVRYLINRRSSMAI